MSSRHRKIEGADLFPRLMVLLVFVSILFAAASGWGQTGTSTIRGAILDPQGKAVPGAGVKLINPEKNFSRTAQSSETGGFVFSAVPPGVYGLEAEASGFKRAAIEQVIALVDTSVVVDVHLEIGQIDQTVTILADAVSPVNTVDATIGVPFENRRITEIPLNARNIVNLLSLQAGVTPQGEVNGGRRDQANITLDGVDVNEEQGGLDVVTKALNYNTSASDNQTFAAFASVLRTTPDSVQEFRVTTSNPNADQGRSSGAQISMVTKSGTNQFHGSLYEFHRNTVTTANDWFNNQAGSFGPDDPEVVSGEKRAGDPKLPRPKLIRNIFGGSIGGPILKDRLFFFYNYEGRRDASETSVPVRSVPTETLRQGIVRYNNTSGGVTTLMPSDIARLYPETGGINQAILSLLKTAPLPNDFTTGDNLNLAGYRFNAPTPVELGTHIVRFDLNITPRQTLFARGNYQNDKYGQAPQFPGTPSPDLWLHPKGLVAGHTWTVNNTMVNNARFGLTRQAYSQQGDSAQSLVNVRFVYQPYLYQRPTNRTTPVYNVTDDFSWLKQNHSLQFGTNLRFIRNRRESFANSYDIAVINPSYYAGSGASLTAPLEDIESGALFDTRSAIAAVLGRYSEYTSNIIYNKDGQIEPVGTASNRTFATEEYDFYGQDSWKLRPNLTLTYGLRWGVNTPVNEVNGFQVQPTVSLGEYFERRKAGAEIGKPVIDPITVDLSGPANGKPGYYKMEWNKVAPSIGVAWSPDFGDNFLGRLFGRNGQSVFRGGYRMVYDRIGSQLATSFDLNNTLGFSSSSSISANTYNVTNSLGPLFTGLNPDVRSFPNLEEPVPLDFPLSKPSDGRRRIESTLDDTIQTPVYHRWNVSYGRELPKGLSLELSYIGALGRRLITSRDIMFINNLKDPQSGQTWYDAAGILADLRDKDVPFNSPNVPRIPFFENFYPGNSILNAYEGYFGYDASGDLAGLNPSQLAYSLVAADYFGITDWTFIQDILDTFSPAAGPYAFFQPQYGTLGVYSTIGKSWYNGASVSLRQRLGSDVTFDFNYTYSKSFDYTSQLIGGYTFTTTNGLIRNPLKPEQARAVSDFDITHNFNANYLVALPFGKGKKFLSNAPGVVDALLGGWQLSGILRLHSGLPFDLYDIGQWATNWQTTSNVVRLKSVAAETNRNYNGEPNAFQDPVAVYKSFRNARAGEDGDRNYLRLPGYFCLDSALSKTFRMPYAEGHQLQFRWEVFNVTNTQPFGIIDSVGLLQDPWRSEPNPGFGRYIGSQTPSGETRPGRVMQFALRYVF
jgi:hypothetical protein